MEGGGGRSLRALRYSCIAALLFPLSSSLHTRRWVTDFCKATKAFVAFLHVHHRWNRGEECESIRAGFTIAIFVRENHMSSRKSSAVALSFTSVSERIPEQVWVDARLRTERERTLADIYEEEEVSQCWE